MTMGYGMGMSMPSQMQNSMSTFQPVDMGYGLGNPGYNFSGLPGYDLNGLPTNNSMPNIQLPTGYDGNTMGLPMPSQSFAAPGMMMGGGKKKKTYYLKKVGQAK